MHINIYDVANLLVVGSVGLSVTTLTFAVLWIRARERILRTRLDTKRLTSISDATSDRIEHLVNAVEAMAVEVERISEAQRFTAQVLAERSDKPALSSKRIPERVVTPH